MNGIRMKTASVSTLIAEQVTRKTHEEEDSGYYRRCILGLSRWQMSQVRSGGFWIVCLCHFPFPILYNLDTL